MDRQKSLVCKRSTKIPTQKYFAIPENSSEMNVRTYIHSTALNPIWKVLADDIKTKSGFYLPEKVVPSLFRGTNAIRRRGDEPLHFHPFHPQVCPSTYSQTFLRNDPVWDIPHIGVYVCYIESPFRAIRLREDPNYIATTLNIFPSRLCTSLHPV